MKHLIVILDTFILIVASWMVLKRKAGTCQVKAISKQVKIAVSRGKTKTIVGFCNYEVKPGDNLWSIARSFTVLEWMIREHNPTLGKTIFPGQVIKIPLVAWKKYRGKASWYGPGFYGKPMTSGEIYNQKEILIAHRHLPIGSEAKIINLKNGRWIISTVRDRGPYAETDIWEVDLSYNAALALGVIEDGVISVKIKPLNTHLRKWVKGYQDLV